MRTDLVIDPLGADVRDVCELAALAEGAGFDGVWTFDHLSGVVAGRRWSRDPFVLLGAAAAVTTRVRIGVLVANVVNRHPVQLASAVSSLQSLAPGRVACGLGAGATADSPFAVEQLAVGRTPDRAAINRARLLEHVTALRAIWAGATSGEPVTFTGRHVVMREVTAVVSPAPMPPLVIGASGVRTVRLAAEVAEGVNIRRSPRLGELVAAAREARRRSGRTDATASFEISVFERLDVDHPLGGDVEELHELGVDARTLLVSPPFPSEVVAAVGAASGGRLERGDLSR